MMDKKLFLLFIILAFLSGCNLPGSQAPSQDQVATIVAMTLNPDTLPASQTPQPLSQPPSVDATWTVEASASPTLTDTATQPPTPTITATETPVPTSTVSLDDPKLTLGSPAWQDTLENGKKFGLGAGGYDDDNTSIQIQNGAMVISSSSTLGYRGWRLTSPTPKDFYLEANFLSASCGSGDSFGLVFRARDYSSGEGYYYGINCSGSYSLLKWTKDGTEYVQPATPAPSLHSGAGQVNSIGVMANGESLKLYANQKLLTEITDSSIISGGHIGLFVSGYSGSLRVELQDIAYWDLP